MLLIHATLYFKKSGIILLSQNGFGYQPTLRSKALLAFLKAITRNHPAISHMNYLRMQGLQMALLQLRKAEITPSHFPKVCLSCGLMTERMNL